MAPSLSPAPSDIRPGFMLPGPVRQLAVDILADLREMSFDGVGVSRETYGESETAAFSLLESRARDAGFEIEWDAARNLIIRLPGQNPELPAVATGSHLDSVPEGGNYDGAAGVVAGLAVLVAAQQTDVPRRSMEVYALRGEESAWFGGPCYFGTRAMFGQLTEDDFQTPHRDGTKTLEDCMRAAGADIDRLKTGTPLLNPSHLAGWLELHIEQGPILTAREKPVGVVTGIRGNHRHRRVVCTGQAAHSGAVPRWLRQDAVLAMADLMVRIDEHWRVLLEWGEDLVVTAGIVETNPREHAISRVPGEVSFALEYRSQNLKTLQSFEALIQSECEQVAKKRGVRFDLGVAKLTRPATMAPPMIDLLEAVCKSQQVPYEVMASGAGHDTSVFANAGIPSGMVFVRNDKGSHNPDEKMEFPDFFLATEVLGGAMLAVANDQPEDSK
ncbi:MAG: Zn-dependent hydrolase [Rhodospirillales bacterium]